MAQQSGLFGMSPDQVFRAQQQQDLQASQAFGQQVGGLFAPLAQSAYGLNQGFARGIQGDSPEMRKASDFEAIKQEAQATQRSGTPEYFEFIASKLEERGYLDEASGLRQQALKQAQEASKYTLDTANIASQIAKRDWEMKKPATPPSVGAEAERKASSLGYNSYRDAPLTVRKAIDKEIEDVKTRNASLMAGKASPIDINRLQDLEKNVLGDAKTLKSTAELTKKLFNSVASGDKASLFSLQSTLAKLVGDSRLSNFEIQNVLGRLGIVGDIQNGITQFLTGELTQEKLREVKKLVELVSDSADNMYYSAGQSFNTKLDAVEAAEQVKNAFRVKLPTKSTGIDVPKGLPPEVQNLFPYMTEEERALWN